MAKRVLIVDDEAPARRKLRRFVAELSDWLVVGEARSVATAVAAIGQHAPDIVLLDIQLGDGTGFDVIDQLSRRCQPRVVFVTAYDEFALRAFDVHAQDYLLKPVERGRFVESVRRIDRGANAADLAGRLQQVMQQLAPTPYLKRLYVESNERGQLLLTANIIRIESDRNYVVIHTKDAHHKLRQTLRELMQRLDPESFAQVNRSIIVNLDAVAEIQSWFRGDRLLILRDGAEIRVSRAYMQRSPILSGWQ